MNQRKVFPFERNNYYYGKLLTARDFEAEQGYLNGKRRFHNSLLHGRGVVTGLGVVRADDASVIVQSGLALDAWGREVIVPETAVVKLSTVAGFSAIEGDRAYLGIRYAETPTDEVYAAMGEGEGEGTRFNKQREGYELFVESEAQVHKIPQALEAFVTATAVYADRDFELVQHTPAYVTVDGDVRIVVELHKHSGADSAFSYAYQLHVPGFSVAGDTLSIHADNLVLARGERVRREYVLTPQSHLWGGGGSVTFTISDISVRKDTEMLAITGSFDIALKPVKNDIEQQFIYASYSRAMDETIDAVSDEKLWLAEIELFRSEQGDVIVDAVTSVPFGQYVYGTAQLRLLDVVKTYYPASGTRRAPEQALMQAVNPGVVADQGAPVRMNSCGVFDLPLGLGYKAKQTFFSDEILHGLGKGSVFVEVGLEYITSAGHTDHDYSEIYLGDTDIFASEGTKSDGRVLDIATAVKVLPERGTFVVGVRMKQASDLISVRIRWYAFRLDELGRRIPAGGSEGKYMMLNPDTIIVPPKGTAHVSPVFINMDTEVCNYQVVDAEGGTIDNNGVYTAPSKEGVYEIRVEAVSDPKIYAHAFAIVTQKKRDE